MVNSTVKENGDVKYISIPPDQEVVIDRGIEAPVNLLGDGTLKFATHWCRNLNRMIDLYIDAITGRKETYSQLLRRVIRTSRWLLSLGLTTKDVISMCSYNNMDYTVTVLASFFTGIKLAPLDPSSPASDICHCLKLTKPRLIFCEQESAAMLRSVVQSTGLLIKIVVYDDPQNSFKLWEVANENSIDDESFPVVKVTNVLDTAIILFSSGTTGFQKAICVTHYALYFHASALLNHLTNPLVFMYQGSTIWMGNITLLILAVFAGHTRVMYRAFDVTNFFKFLHDYEVSLTCVTPLHVNKLLQHPEYCQHDTSKLKYVSIVGSASVSRQIEEVIHLFPHSTILHDYGMTEAGGPIFKPGQQTIEDLQRTKKTTIGKPIPGFIYKVIDEDERPVEPNTPGELRIKFRGVMKGYYQQPELNADAFDSEGFLKSGDVVYYDEQLRFYFVDRLKEMFKYQGWLISPVYIEAELMSHPNVKEAAVIGLPMEDVGELPTACVSLLDPSQTKPEEIIEYIAKKLPDRYHLRGGVHIIDSVPVTGSAKIRRKDLRAMVMELRNKSIA